MIFFAKIGIFRKSIAGHRRSESASNGQLDSTHKPIELCMASYQGLYAKFVFMMSPKCPIVENDGELILMALHTLFVPQQQYSRVFALFLAFHALVYRWGCQFLSLFSQDNEHIRSWHCFSSSKIRTQFSHTFCNITMIFKIMPQYFPALLKRIHNHIPSAEG